MELSLLQGTDLRAVKELPDLLVSIYEVHAVMKANVYGIVRQFLEQPTQMTSCRITRLLN